MPNICPETKWWDNSKKGCSDCIAGCKDCTDGEFCDTCLPPD